MSMSSPLTELGTYLAKTAPNLYASQRSTHQPPLGISRLPRVGAIVGAMPRVFEMTPTQHNSEYIVRLRIENMPGIDLRGQGNMRISNSGGELDLLGPIPSMRAGRISCDTGNAGGLRYPVRFGALDCQVRSFRV
jgi:hypothetical protein